MNWSKRQPPNSPPRRDRYKREPFICSPRADILEDLADWSISPFMKLQGERGFMEIWGILRGERERGKLRSK